jgi:hypothetical protein
VRARLRLGGQLDRPRPSSFAVYRAPGTTVHAHLGRAGGIAACIYRRWQVGPYEWQVKHLRWFLEHGTTSLEGSVRCYRYWLTIRVLIIALGREADWLPHHKPLDMVRGHRHCEGSIGRPLKRPT